MARPLTYALDQIMLRPSRRPGWRVYLYDLKTSGDTIDAIVRDLTLDPLTGPLDVTSAILDVNVEEVAGDFVSSGVPSSKISFTIADPTPGNVASVWDPQFSAGDSSLPARFLRRGNVIRIKLGDGSIDEADWPFTFTGVLIGQAGVDRGRSHEEQGRSLVTMAALSRESDYVNDVRDSEEFLRGSSYIVMGTEVAQKVMGLDIDELDFAGWGSQTTGLPIQFVQQSGLVSIAQLMFSDGFMPRFDGAGKLTQTSGDIAKAPARTYLNLETISAIVKPFADLDPVNSVEVIGLEGVKTKVIQPRQLLAETSVTVGFFTADEEISVYWSEDRTQLAEDINLNVLLSVNGGISVLGGGESWEPILSEGASGLTIGMTLSLSTGYAPYIIIFLAIHYIVLAAIPDTVTTAVFAGVTIPIGRIVQAAALAVIMLLMTKIARGKYEMTGNPVEFVHKEIRALAEIAGVLTRELNRVSIENHLVQTQADADEAARLVLFRQQARGNPRQISALHDLRLEADDIFQIPGDRRFLIEKITYALTRSPAPIVAGYSVFEVTTGLEP